jgi:hypothetical protein
MDFKLNSADASFATAARQQFTYDFTIAARADIVFETIARPERLDRWIPDLNGARWLTAAPYGVGSVREVRLGFIRVDERVLVWEPGQRFAFSVVKASLPVLRRMVEDFRLSSIGSDRTRVQWTIAYQTPRLLSPLERLAYPRFSRIFEEGSRRLRAHLEASQPR